MQTTKRAPDRKKLRREYLQRKGQEYAITGVLGTTMIPALMGFTVCVLMPFYAWSLSVGSGYGELDPTLFIFLVILGVSGSIYFGRMLWLCWRGAKQSIQTARGLDYVPPVTPDAFPADEILVRGAEEPLVQQSEVLLRAAKEREASTEELLRASLE
jgi:hypothetical protein